MVLMNIFWKSVLVAVILFGNFSKCDSVNNERELNLAGILNNITKQNQNVCFKCGLAVGTMLNLFKLNDALASIDTKLKPFCIKFKLSNEICTGIVNVYGPVVIDAMRMVSLKPQQLCSMFLEGICPGVAVPEQEWTVKLPDVPKPPVKNMPFPQADNPKLKVLQLNDVHLDLFYSEGSNANCDDPLCCRTFSNTKELGVYFPAGRWGAYSCDLPARTVKKSLEHIAKQHPDIDYIMWVGDLTPHDIWRKTQSEILITIRKSIEQMKQAFPNTLVLPNIGKHDMLPDGTFAPPWVAKKQFKMSWLLLELYSFWKDWLPESAKSTFLQGGFYSAPVRTGLRVISLNTYYCYNMNWWLYVNSTDPSEQLDWLARQLQQAEDAGEKVHIIGHMAPGHIGCLKTWSENYYRIINRYEATVTAQFHGSSHNDEFKVFYDEQDNVRPISVSYLGPSLSPFLRYNPGYRIYHIDAHSTWEVLDYESWVLDLDKANSKNQENLEWDLCYTAKSMYNLSSLRPNEWNDLIKSMEVDDNIFLQFYKNYHRNSPTSKPSTAEIKEKILCDLKCGKSHSREQNCGTKPNNKF